MEWGPLRVCLFSSHEFVLLPKEECGFYTKENKILVLEEKDTRKCLMKRRTVTGPDSNPVPRCTVHLLTLPQS